MKYVIIYKISQEGMNNMPNKVEQQKGFQKWMQWVESCGDKLVEKGTPLANGVAITGENTESIQTGIVGYAVFDVANKEEALKLLETNPHLEQEGWSIELFEAKEM